MHNLLLQLKQLTVEMMDKLDRATAEDFVQFVEKREIYIQKVREMEPEQADREKYAQLVKEILQYDQPIMARMNELKQEASAELIKIGQSRVQKQAYNMNYAAESAFIDRRN